MKILIPTLEYPPQIGGIGSYVFNLAKNWPNENDEHIICAPTQTGDDIFDKQNTLKVYRKNMMFKVFRPRWLKLFFILLKIIKKENIERVLVHHVLPVGYVIYLIKKIRKINYDIFLHGYDFGLAIKRCPKRKKFAKICSRADRIIVNSIFLQKKVICEFPEFKEKIIVVYPCSSIQDIKIDIDKLNEIEKKYNPEKRPLILTSSRIVKRKGHSMVIKSLSKVIKQIPNVLYLICGEGEYKQELIELVKKEKIEQSVKFIDFVSSDELPYVYSMANVFAMPSRQLNDLDVEGFGIVFIEANLFGTPVIGGNSGGMNEAIENEKSGLVVDSNSESDIADAILKLLQDKELSVSLGRFGRNRVQTDFNWSKQLEKIL